jgi:hypothetical protein
MFVCSLISLTKTKRQTTTIHTDNHKVDYELNRSKAIKQKIEAAERPLSVVVKHTMGASYDPARLIQSGMI